MPIWKAYGLVMAAALAPITAAAFPFEGSECNVPFNSKFPYQADVELQSSEGTTTLKRLVYRGDDLFRTQVDAYGDTNAITTKSQAGFALSNRSSKGITIFQHRNPTDKYAVDQQLTDAEFESDGPDGKKVQHVHYEYLPDETMTIGACTLVVKHSKWIAKETGVITESWFSRDLQTSLKTKIVTKDGKTVTLEVKSLSTDNVPTEAEIDVSVAEQPHNKGLGLLEDDVAAKLRYEKAADAGDANAMVSLGNLYFLGRGVPQDYAIAKFWTEKGANAGNAQAMFNLGVLYEQGTGVPQNYATAKLWYEKAVNAGYASAMNSIGNLYVQGTGVSQDYATAKLWYEKAANASVPVAMFNLGALYEQGVGVPQNFATAKLWYEKAANAGNASAMGNLGGLYFLGTGVPQDFATAKLWIEKAVNAGNAQAMVNLGALYEHGMGVPQNYATARLWYEKAVAGGDSDAQAALDRLKAASH